MPLSDEQMARLEALGGKKALSDAEMEEMEALAGSAAPAVTDPVRHSDTPGESQSIHQPMAPQEQDPGWFSPRSASGAAVQGLGQGDSLGFSDELAGVGRAAMGAGANLAKATLQSIGPRALLRAVLEHHTGVQGLPDSAIDAIAEAAHQDTADALGLGKTLGESYTKGRDDLRQDNAIAKEAHPRVYGAGEFAGGMAVPVPGGGWVKSAGALKNLAKLAAQGGAMGTVAGAGYSNADSPGGVAMDSAIGGAGGAIAAPVIGGAFAAAGPVAQRAADSNAARALGLRPALSNLAQKMGMDSVADIRAFGHEGLERGLVRAGGTPEGVQTEVLHDIARTGPAIGGVVRELDQKGAGRVASELADEMAAEQANTWNATELRRGGPARAFIDDVRKEGELGAQRAAQGAGPIPVANPVPAAAVQAPFGQQVQAAHAALTAQGIPTTTQNLMQAMGLKITPAEFGQHLMNGTNPPGWGAPAAEAVAATAPKPHLTPLEDLNRLKSTMYDDIHASYGSPEPPLVSKLQQRTVGQLRRAIEDNARNVDPQLADELVGLNSRFSFLKKVQGLSSNEVTRDASKNKAGAFVKSAIGGLAGVGLATGHHAAGGAGLGALLALAAGQQALRRTPSTLAVGLNALAPRLPTMGAPIARSSAEQLAKWLDEPSEQEKAKATAEALRRAR